MILERTGHELRRARRELVDQHDHRLVDERAAAVSLHLVDDLPAVPGRVDDAVLQELVRDVRSLVDEPARIGTQVEDDPRERCAARPRAQLRRRREELVVRVLLELLDPQVPDATREELRRDARHVDDLAHEVERDHLGGALVPDGHLHVRPRRTAQVLHQLVEGDLARVAPVHRDDRVAGADAGVRGGRALDGCEHDELVVAVLDLDSDAAELALGVTLEALELLGGHVARVGVELAHHALDGAVHELRPVDRVDVLVLDLHEHASELLDGGERGVPVGGTGAAREGRGARASGEGAHGENEEPGSLTEVHREGNVARSKLFWSCVKVRGLLSLIPGVRHQIVGVLS